MLISPPFLPAAPDGQKDEDFVFSAMQGDGPGKGAFPVSLDFSWHGGLHLTAQPDPKGSSKVRVIADGTVVWQRAPKPATYSLTPNDPLGYGAGWTSDGTVVIKHSTEIGDGDDAVIEFYSIYQHLSAIEPTVKTGQAIYRKDEIGVAGLIYGEANKMHFEIVCDDANLKKIVGRSSGPLDISKDGRTDAVYGTVYFALPVDTQIFAADMRAAQRAANDSAAAAKKSDAAATDAEASVNALPTNADSQKTKKLADEATRLRKAATTADDKSKAAAKRYSDAQAAPPVYTTVDGLFIGITYDKGRSSLSTWKEDGAQIGAVADPGTEEYDLYEHATHLYPECPSAGYELLRFGRILGPDALSPADAPHWRKISYPGGEGWVDLRPDAIKKFSDADFPHWRGWFLIDDDTDGNSRCDSDLIAKLLLDDGQSFQSRNKMLEFLLSVPAAYKALARTACKIPSEWDISHFDERYAWLKDSTKIAGTILRQPMKDDDFAGMKAHVSALAFWTDAGLSSDAMWHFNPKEFVATLRRCGWLSKAELAQTLPRKLNADGSNSLSWGRALGRVSNFQLPFNKATRKYLVDTRLRLCIFLAQVFTETDKFNTLAEYAPRNGLPGSSHAYGPFYGRGIMQLTWAGNYDAYGRFRGFAGKAPGSSYIDPRITAASTFSFSNPADNPKLDHWAWRYDPDQITHGDSSCDSGGYYWVSKTYRGRHNINQACDAEFGIAAVCFVSWLVNGGSNGYVDRVRFFSYLKDVLLDDSRNTGQQTVRYPTLNSSLTGSFPSSPANSSSLTVFYDR